MSDKISLKYEDGISNELRDYNLTFDNGFKVESKNQNDDESYFDLSDWEDKEVTFIKVEVKESLTFSEFKKSLTFSEFKKDQNRFKKLKIGLPWKPTIIVIDISIRLIFCWLFYNNLIDVRLLFFIQVIIPFLILFVFKLNVKKICNDHFKEKLGKEIGKVLPQNFDYKSFELKSIFSVKSSELLSRIKILKVKSLIKDLAYHKHIDINLKINKIFQRLLLTLLLLFTVFVFYKCLFEFYGLCVFFFFFFYSLIYYYFLVYLGSLPFYSKGNSLNNNYAEESDYDEVDQNDAQIAIIQTKVDDLKHKIDTYTLESALLGALSLTAYLQPFTGNVIKPDTFILTLNKINVVVHHFLIFEFKLSFIGIRSLFHDTNFLWTTIALFSIFCSILYLFLLVSRKNIYTQISTIVKELELSKNFNSKEEELNNISLETEKKNRDIEERLKDVSKQCKKHLKRCDDIIPRMENSFHLLENLRNLANLFFILLVCVAAFLISYYIGITLLLLTILMRVILVEDFKNFFRGKETDEKIKLKRAKEFLEKGKQYFHNNQNEKAKDEFDKIIRLNKNKTLNNVFISETYMFRGLILSNMGKFDEASTEYEEAIQCIKKNDSDYSVILKSGIHYNMGTNYRRKAQKNENLEDTNELELNNALECHERSLELRKKVNGDVSSSYRAIASIYKIKKMYEEALDNFENAIKEYKKQNKKDWWIATTIESKGSLYLEKFINDGHNKSDFESAKKFFEESLQIREELKENCPENVSAPELLFSFNNIATLYRLNAESLEKDDKTEAKDEFKTALASYNKSLEIEEKLDGDRDCFKGNLYYSLGITNIGLEEYKEAINCLRKSAELRKKINIETKDCIDKIESIISNIEDTEIEQWLEKFKTRKNG
jgi:tetratricopeptide (TPR) repeat protein